MLKYSPLFALRACIGGTGEAEILWIDKSSVVSAGEQASETEEAVPKDCCCLLFVGR